MPFVDLPRTVQPALLDTPEGMAVTPGALGERKPAEGDSPGFLKALDAHFATENLILSTIRSEALGVDRTPEPGFNPWELIKGTDRERHWENYVDVVNRRQFDAVSRDIDRETEARKIQAATPWYLSLPMSMAAGVLDPTILLPGGAFVKSAKGGLSVARSALRVGAATGAAVAAQEVGLQASQQLRSAEESAINIGASVLLGGLLGGAGARLLSHAEWTDAVGGVAKGFEQAGDTAPVPGPIGASVGAERVAADLDGLTISGRATGKTAEATAFLNPGLRLARSPSAVARETAFNAYEMTQVLRGNDAGVASPRAAETLIKEWNAGLIKAATDTRAAFSEYSKRVGGGVLHRAGLGGSAPGRLSRGEFANEVGRAMRRGDQHEIPEVARVAQAWRANVFEPLKNAAIEAKLLPEGVDVKTAESYFSRVYNRRLIETERPQFLRVVTDYLEEEQTKKAEIKGRLATLNDELQRQAQVQAKLGARRERLEARNTDLQSRLAERTMEAQRAEKRAGIVEDRAASIEEEIADTEAFIADMRLAADRDPEFTRRLDDLQAQVRELKKADRSVTEADLQKMEAEEAKAALPPLLRRAAEIAVGKRRPPKVPSFLSWLVENGGIKDTGGDVKAILGSVRARPGLIDNQDGIALDQIARRIQDVSEGQFPHTNEPGGGAPDTNDVLGWIEDAARGREPDWWVNAMSKPEDADTLKSAAALEEIMSRAGAEMKSVRDVADFLKGESSGPVTLEDLDRIAAEMEAAGETIPLTFRRQGVEQEIAVERAKIGEIRTAIQHGIARRRLLERRGSITGARAAEAGIAVRANRGHIGILEDRLDAAAHRREMLEMVDEIVTRRNDGLRKEIEEALGEWEGKSTAEAIAAIKQRTKYEKEAELRFAVQQGGRGPDAPRLTAADRAVDRVVRRILDSDRDLGRDELGTQAEDIANNILHGGPGVQGPASLARGPLRTREFMIPDEKIERWLESDIDMIGRRYHRIMAADVELARKFGTIDMRDQIAAIRQDYERLRAGASPKELDRLAKSEKADIRDIEGVRDLIRGTYDMARWEQNFGRVVRVVNMFNYIRSMGQIVLGSLPEAYRTAMHHGLAPFMETVGKIGSKGFKMSVAEAKLAGNIGERALSHRLATLAEIGDFYTSRGPVEKFLGNMTEVASTWNGVRLWTDWARMVAATATQNRILSVAANYAKASARDKRYLAHLGIDEGMAGAIAERFGAAGETIDGVRVANTEQWVRYAANEADQARDRAALRAFRAAVNKDIDTQVVTKSVADLPLFANTPLGRLLFQFNTFNLASHQRVLLRGMQEGPARFVSGAIALTTIGMAVTKLQALAANRDVPDFAENPGWWISEGLDKGGLIMVPMQLANAVEKLTGLNPVKAPMKAFDESAAQSLRLNNRGVSSFIGGPSAGLIEDIATLAHIPATVATGQKVSEAQRNAGERLLPFNSYLGLRQMLRYVVNPPD